MKKIILFFLLLFSFGLTKAQDKVDFLRTKVDGNRNIVDARLRASYSLNIPRATAWTLNGAKDSIGYVMYNTTLQRFGVYHGSGVWKAYATIDEVNTLIDGKVDTVSGKGLSTEDYTTTEKSKLAGIAAGAEVNVNPDWNATSGDAQILNKPVVVSSELDPVFLAQKGVNNGVATLNSSGKVPNAQIPSLALVDTYVAASQAAMLALSTAEQGDVAIRTDLSKTFILIDANYSTLASWKELLSPIIPAETDPVWGASASAGISPTNISNWNSAYGWGNHAGLYVGLTGNQTVSGDKTFAGNSMFYYGLSFATGGSSPTATIGGSTSIQALTLSRLFISKVSNNGGAIFDLSGISGTNIRTFSLPDASGTLALTSDLSNYVDLTSNQTISGTKTFTGIITGQSITSTGGTFRSSSNGSATEVSAYNTGTGDAVSTLYRTNNTLGYLANWYANATGGLWSIGVKNNTSKLSIYNQTVGRGVPFSGSNALEIDSLNKITLSGQLQLASTITNGTYTYTLPSATGTLALTSALSSYLLLTGGTLSGTLNGTYGSFSGTTGSVLTGYALGTGTGVRGYVVGTGFGVSGSATGDGIGGSFTASGTQAGLVAVNSLGTGAGAPAAVLQSYLGNPVDLYGQNSGGGSARVAYFSNTGGLFINGGNESHNLNLDLTTTTTGHKQGLVFSNGSINRSAIKQEIMNYGSSLFDLAFLNGPALEERMRIASSGNIGIGNTAPDFKLDVTGGSVGTRLQVSAGINLTLEKASGPYLLFTTSGTERAAINANTSGDLMFTTNGSGSTKLTLAASGVATFSAGITVQSSINNGTSWVSADGFRKLVANTVMTFNNSAGNTEAFLSGAGFFKASNYGTYVGITGTYHELVSNAAGSNVAQFTNSHASNPYGVYVGLNGGTINNATNYFYAGGDASTTRFVVYSNGGIANYSANNINLSDERAKKDIAKAGSFWSVIKAIEFDKYQYKDQKDGRNLLGVMAQQVEKIYPGWVNNAASFGKASDGTNLKSVYEQQLQYGVNIVVQEAMKRIEALEAEVKNLKSK